MDDFELGTRLVTIHAQPYAAGESTGWHRHVRGQILAASEGLMVATTELGAWYVPAGHALWIPPGLDHDVAMRGPVMMCSAYVEGAAVASLPSRCKVIIISALLAAAIEALAGSLFFMPRMAAAAISPRSSSMTSPARMMRASLCQCRAIAVWSISATPY